MSSTRAEVAFGAAWMVAARASNRILGFASTLVLARLLAPAEFGIVAIASAVVEGLELFRAFGFDLVLVQNRSASASHYDTAWTLNLLVSGAVAVVLAALALPAASFYDQPELHHVLLALAARPVVGALQNIGIVELQKTMRFQRLFWLVFLGKAAQLAIALPLAFWLRNYWALVVSIVAGRAVEVVLSYLMHAFRPRLTLRHWREMMAFSKWLLANNAIQFFTRRAADFTIAKVAGARALGLFSLASEIGLLPSSELAMPINRAIFPGYARRSGDLEALRRGLLQVVGLITIVIVPLGVGIALTADLAVPILLGDQWLDATRLVQILALCGMLEALGSNTGYLVVALGKPRIVTAVAIFQLVVLLPALLLGSRWAGAEGAAWANLISVGTAIPLSYGIVLFHLDLPLSRLLGAIWRPVLAVAAMAAAVLWIGSRLPAPGTLAEGLLWLSVEAVAGALVYLVTILLAWWLAGAPTGAEVELLHVLSSRARAAASSGAERGRRSPEA